MKGFLNKVSNKISGKPTESKGAEGNPAVKGANTVSGSGSGGAGAGAEANRSETVLGPKGREKRRMTSSSRDKGKSAQVKELPALSETQMMKREALFKQKLQLCCVVFDFEDGESDPKGKEIKRDTLVELADYVNTPVGQKIFTEQLMPDIVEMVRVNLFRALPPQVTLFIRL